jgi:hypothetical protein
MIYDEITKIIEVVLRVNLVFKGKKLENCRTNYLYICE